MVTAVEAPVEAAPLPTRRSRRRPPGDLLGGLVVVAVVVVGHLLVLSQNRRFYYQDDAQAYFLPMWRDIGMRLREGTFPVLAPEHWMAGNYPIESQIGLWNPVLLALNALAPSVDRLALLAAAVAIGFAALLGVGVYRVALAHGARRDWAVVVGVAAPFGGWTLWYDTSSWTIALICTAFVVHAWASLVRYVDGRSGPLPALLWLYLDLSTGYPYGAAAAGLVTLGVLVGGLARGRARLALLRTAGLALAAVACASIAYLPGFASYDVSLRIGLDETFFNDGFLVLPWSEALTGGLPSALPQLAGFAGPETVPSTYTAWFLLPALPFLRWSAVRDRLRELAGPLTVAGLLLLASAGPAVAGPIRWPARWMGYLTVALLVCFAVAATAGIARDRWRTRAAVSAGIVIVLGLRAAALTAPRLGGEHLDAAVLVLALGGLVLLAWRWRGPRMGTALLVLSVPLVVWTQVSLYPSNLNFGERNLPSDYAAADAVFPDRPGSTLQLGSSDLVPDKYRYLEIDWGQVNVGSFARGLGRDYVNAYTPLGHTGFSKLLCMDFLGDTCPDARRKLFARDRDTGQTVADLMALDRVVLQRAQYPRAHLQAAPRGWTRAEVNNMVVVLERESGIGPGPGGVTGTQGAQVQDVRSASDTRWRGLVRSEQDGGRVVFSRLAWPGYSATFDGRPVPVSAHDEVFLAVDLPAGSGLLDVRFEPPGWRLGAVLASLGLLTTLALVLHDRRARRPGRART